MVAFGHQSGGIEPIVLLVDTLDHDVSNVGATASKLGHPPRLSRLALKLLAGSQPMPGVKRGVRRFIQSGGGSLGKFECLAPQSNCLNGLRVFLVQFLQLCFPVDVVCSPKSLLVFVVCVFVGLFLL